MSSPSHQPHAQGSAFSGAITSLAALYADLTSHVAMRLLRDVEKIEGFDARNFHYLPPDSVAEKACCIAEKLMFEMRTLDQERDLYTCEAGNASMNYLWRQYAEADRRAAEQLHMELLHFAARRKT